MLIQMMLLCLFFDDAINELIKQFGIFDFVLDSPLRTIFFIQNYLKC